MKSSPMLASTVCAPQLLACRSAAVFLFITPRVKSCRSALAMQLCRGQLTTVPYTSTPVAMGTWPALVTADRQCQGSLDFVLSLTIPALSPVPFTISSSPVISLAPIPPHYVHY
ncbi:hypothetical protein HPB50_006565 [Hyalomma asiaticum]|uniref:Uncharacterized protein n=1 Tax=Hyalomma asiaticum TaxID=266040 RepID=A0ACB7RPN1_HYAAI|nr:hypothetical protein HPB50_006565 [Hyalomma asiaticum]